MFGLEVLHVVSTNSLRLHTRSVCMCICIFVSGEGWQFSAVSNGEPMEASLQE